MQPSQPAEAGRLLSWALVPYSTYKARRSTITRARPPATFRLQGLVTLLAACSLRARAGFVSRRRRSWDSPFGAFSSHKVPTAFPRPMSPRTVSPVGIPVRRNGRAGPTGRGSWDLTLARVPGDRRGLARPPLDAPLGFLPF
jgi:hypothetical protein